MYPEDTITIDLEPSIEELLEIGVGRLKEKSAWKLWQWLADDKEFLDADSFRCHCLTLYKLRVGRMPVCRLRTPAADHDWVQTLQELHGE